MHSRYPIMSDISNIFSDPGYGIDDPRYIGAWWLGYLVIPCFLLIPSVLLFFFPKRMPVIQRKADKVVTFNPDSKEKINNSITGINQIISSQVKCLLILLLDQFILFNILSSRQKC